MLQQLTFEIKETPVLYNHNGEILTSTSHKCIVKDSGTQLSVMKSSYNPMYNSDFQETVNRMSEISGFEISGYSEFDGGKIIFSHLKNNIENFDIGGHKIEDYLVLGSSFDGRLPFFIGTTTILIRCKNQFSKISKVEKVRHTKSAPKKREELLKGLQIYFSNRKKMYENFTHMQKIKVDQFLREEVINRVMNVSMEDRLGNDVSVRKLNQMDELRNMILFEEKELGSNLWATFNGVTRYTTHSLNKKEEVFGNMFGTANLLNQKAYEMAVELL